MKKAITLSLLLFFLFPFISRSAPKATNLDTGVTNPLIPTNYTKLLHSYLEQSFDLLYSISKNKSRYLKQQKYTSFSSNITIFTEGLSTYLPLSFGTPPQTLHFILDTGSSITWFKCDSNHSRDPKILSIFNPSLSSSSKYLTCNHPKHKQFTRGKPKRCKNCEVNNSKNCLRLIDYEIHYDAGFTYGTWMSEILNFPGQHTISDFVIGCSSSSTLQFSGIAGFGRGTESLPSQTRIKKFSYCLPSIEDNGKPQKSYLLLNGHSSTNKLTYTQFLDSQNIQKLKRYYIVLKDIIIGNKSVTIPSKYRVPGKDGCGGTAVDSGSSFTSMKRSIFETVRQEFQTQLGEHTFIGYAKHKLPCFNISGKEVNNLPNLSFRFSGGAMMNLPRKNYLVETTRNDISCLLIVPQTKANSRWPTIILGNSLIRDFYLEFDLAKNRFGFHAIKC